jgi:hypothetical protein
VKAFTVISEEASKNSSKPVRRFVLYSLTFLKRLGESGCDVWTLAQIAGHSQIGISSPYVHPSDDAMFAAMSRPRGHKLRRSTESAIPTNQNTGQLTPMVGLQYFATRPWLSWIEHLPSK